MMGYKMAVRIRKTRVITHYDGCEICIDEVVGLGSFIAMEKLTKSGNAVKIQDELFAFLKTVGVNPADRVHFGYDILMLQKAEKKPRN